MVNRNVLAAKWTELADRLTQVRKHCKSSVAELEADREARDLVAFNLMLAVQTCADVASHLIADESWAPPKTLGESFTRLAEHGIIQRELANTLRQAVALRNLIVHGYAGVDLEPLQRASTIGLADLEAFARAVSEWTNAQTPSSGAGRG